MNNQFNLNKALEYADDGYFVTHIYFDDQQSLHKWNNKYYYEDGAVVSEKYLESEELFSVGNVWRIKFTPDEVDKDKLNNMHIKANGYMLSGTTYEECIIKDKRA